MSARQLKTFFRVLMFFITFVLEVRVKAAESVQLPEAELILQTPRGCLRSGVECAVGTSNGEKYGLHLGTTIVTLDQSSIIIRTSVDQLRLVKGTVWVQATGALTVTTEFGRFSVQGPGEFWLAHGSDRSTVSVTGEETQVFMRPLGANEEIAVLPGMENWLGKVGAQGFAESGVPMAIDSEPHLRRWARLFPKGKKQFEKEVASFHKTWLHAAETSALVNRELYQRKVASIVELEERKKSARAKVKARDAELTELFRRKTFSGE